MNINQTITRLSMVLTRFVDRAGYTSGQLSRLTGIPKATVVNWLTGRVNKPRCREDLIKLAQVLHLSAAEVSELLQSAGYPTIIGIDLAELSDEERELLDAWLPENVPSQNPPPFQAVPDLPYFVGRQAEIEALTESLLNTAHPKLYFLHGMAGVGKTALAARLAYQLRPHFPDGVLWASLENSDPMCVLSTFAQAYGRAVNDLADLDSRSRVVRQLLANKRVLIILDNARSSEQIFPLLPPTGSCAVLVTTQRQDLWHASGAYRLQIGPFSSEDDEGLELFSVVLGPSRVQAEQPIFKEITDFLGRHPLALAIAASRLAYEPDWTAVDFLAQVRKDKNRLNTLTYGDRSLRLSLEPCWNALSDRQKDFLKQLTGFGNTAFTIEPVSFITGTPPDQVKDTLRQLYSLSLVQNRGPDRYQLHPLVRDFLLEKTQYGGQVPATVPETILGEGIPADESPTRRVLSYYLRYLQEHCMDFKALDRAVTNIQLALETAHDRGLWTEVIHGALTFHRFLEVRGLYELDRLYLRRAEGAARRSGDPIGLVSALHFLGRIERLSGNLDQAEKLLTESLSTAREDGPLEQVPAVLAELGIVAILCGDYPRAELLVKEGWAHQRAMGNPAESSLLYNVQGILAEKRGDFVEARKFFAGGLELAQQVGDRIDASIYLTNIGVMCLHLQEFVEGEARLLEALRIVEEAGHHQRKGIIHLDLGDAARLRGDYVQAAARFEKAYRIACEVESELLVMSVLNSLGELQLEQGEPHQALETFRQCLEKARQAGCKELEGCALFGTARAAKEQGQLEQARESAQESIAVFEELGHHKVELVREWLEV